MRIHWKPSEHQQIVAAALNLLRENPHKITDKLGILREAQKVLPKERHREITAAFPFRYLIEEVRSKFYDGDENPPVKEAQPAPSIQVPDAMKAFFELLVDEAYKRVMAELSKVEKPAQSQVSLVSERLPYVFDKAEAKANVVERSITPLAAPVTTGILIVGLLPGQIQIIKSRLFNLKDVSLSFLSAEEAAAGKKVYPRHRNYLMTKFIGHSTTLQFASVPRERLFQVNGGLSQLEQMIRYHHSMANKR